MTRRHALLCFIVCGSLAAHAQVPAAVEVGPAEYSAPEKARLKSAALLALPSLRERIPAAPAVRLRPVADAAFAKAASRKDLPVAGVHVDLPEDIRQTGRWEYLAGGAAVWRAAIHSPGAAGVRIHFSEFAVGSGRVWLHNDDPLRPEIAGPYTGRGIFGDGEFWSETVYSDTVTIEYEPAGGEQPPAAVPFRVARISHRRGTNSAAAGCELDVSCYSEWAETARATARIAFESDGGTFVCSGTLLNTRNSSFIPYFLTAYHCISDDKTARTVEAYWFYQTSRCNGSPPSLGSLPKSVGSRYLVSAPRDRGDYSLLRLTSVPDGVQFAGWTATEVPVNGNLTAISHPSGDYKRFATGYRSEQYYGTDSRPKNAFYWPLFTEGFVEQGSSGGGVFTKPGVLAAVVSAVRSLPRGQTVCDDRPQVAIVGRFSVAYPALSDFLEERVAPPAPTVATGGILVSGIDRNFSLPAVDGHTLFNAEGSLFRIDVPAGATALTVETFTNTPNADVDLHVRYGTPPDVVNGKIVADYTSDAENTGDEKISATPRSDPPLKAGTYYIALALYNKGVAAYGSIVATVETAAPPPGSGPRELVSGQPVKFSYGAYDVPMLHVGDQGYKITVPPNATGLRVRAFALDPSIDIDLYVRYAAEVDLGPDDVLADYRAEGDTGDEYIEITPDSERPLLPGTYYISVLQYATGVPVEGRVIATVDYPVQGPAVGTLLTSGLPVSFPVAAVQSATLYAGAEGYRIEVPPGTKELMVGLQTRPPSVDLDLFVRYGQPPEVKDGTIVADFRSVGDTGNEFLLIDGTSFPAVRPGTYYIAYAVYTKNATAQATILATASQNSYSGSVPRKPRTRRYADPK